MKSLLDEFLPLKRAAFLVGIGESTLRRNIRKARAGLIPRGDVPPHVIFNGKYYFRLDELTRWFNRKIEQSA